METYYPYDDGVFLVGDKVYTVRDLRVWSSAFRKKNEKYKVIQEGSLGDVIYVSEDPLSNTPTCDVQFGDIKVKDVKPWFSKRHR